MGERRVTADGRILEKMPDGSVVEVGRQGGQGGVIPLGPRDNSRQNAETRQANNDARDATNKDRDYKLQRKKFIAELAAKGQTLDENDNIVPIPNWQPPLTPDQMQDQKGRVARLNALVGQINRTQQLGNEGPLATKGLSSLYDFNPFSDANVQFDTAGASLSQQGLGAFRVPGTGTVSDRDAMMFDRANLPDSSNMDAQSQEQLLGLRARVDEEYRALGLPTPQWVTPQQAEQQDRRDAAPLVGGMEGGTIENLPGPIDGGISGMGYRGTPLTPASGGLLGPEYRKEPDWDAQAKLEAIVRSGGSFAEFDAASRSMGYPGVSNPQDYSRVQQYLQKHPKTRENLVNPPHKWVKQSGFERGVQGVPGATAIGLANAGSMGALEAVAPEGVNMSREAHPYASMAGEVAGVIGNQAGAMRLTPLGRINNAVGRNLAYDTAYSGARGAAADPENPLRGAITTAPLGMAGSLGGQGAASLVGRGFSGVRSSPSVQWLRDRGVTPTLGQIMRGRASDNGSRSLVAGLEDAISNTPGAGNMVNTARSRGLADANTAIYREVGGPNINGVGEEALTGLSAAKTQAYNDALRGVNIPKNDPRLVAQMNAVNPGRAAAVDEYGDFLGSKLRPVMDDGRPSISGARLQEAMRLLGKEGRAYGKAASGTPYYADVADAIKQTENALVGAAARNAPQAIPKLKAANALNRNLSILDDAGEKALVNPGSSSGVFTAAQLRQAMQANNTKFGKRGLLGFGKSPLAEGQRAMQAVIPNEVPPTGVNMAPIMAGLGAVTAGANEGTGYNSNILRALAVASMLSAPYTRKGAEWTAKGLLDRPQSLRTAGTAIRKAKGLFGSATIPLLLEARQ